MTLDEAHINKALNKALLCHRNGDLKNAKKLYLKIIEEKPKNADCWHLLGALFHQEGKLDKAIKHLDRALMLEPQFPEALNRRGIIYKETGNLSIAEKDFRLAISLFPGFSHALTNLADICRINGKTAESRNLNEKAVELAPDSAIAYNNLGALELEVGNHNEAYYAFKKALKLDPVFVDAAINLSTTQKKLGKINDSIIRMKNVLLENSTYAPAHNCLGLLYYEVQEIEAAHNHFEIACKLKDSYSDAQNNLANTFVRLNKIDKAHTFYDSALRTQPNNPDYWANKATAYLATNNPKKAIEACNKAIGIDAKHPDAIWNRAMAYLVSGKLLDGFSDYEIRWLLPEFQNKGISNQIWKGESLKNKSILIHSEQGYGDTIQFIRYVKIISNRNPKAIYLETHKALRSLMNAIPEIQGTFVPGESLPEVDYHIPIMGLARVFHTTLDTIPAATPYLTIPKNVSYVLPKTFDKPKTLKVGLVWAGRKTHKNNKNRSLTFNAIENITKLPKIQFYSLQIECPDRRDFSSSDVIDLSDSLVDFATSAAALKQLDLLISVDTAIVHLAGALSVKCWVLLPLAADWRWLIGRNDSPWYPSITLFRQRSLGDWNAVIKEVKTNLRNLV